MEISDGSLATVKLVCRYWRQTATEAKRSEIHVVATAAHNSTCQPEKHGKSKREKWAHPADPDHKLKEDQKVTVNDFEAMKVLGKGHAGKVMLVRHKATFDLFALKVITKKRALTEPELQRTLTERAVLKRMATGGRNPFVVKLWWSFHDHDHLFLITDYCSGGDLATQLARWGRLGRHRARFYAAEIVEGVESLHENGIIHRDLKPENILIGSDGHIVLTDFGLSKQFPRRSNTAVLPDEHPNDGAETTNTLCGTAEYLAPEVIQGHPYSFEVDWWSFGTMLYKMLTGTVRIPLLILKTTSVNLPVQTPFWADNRSDMYSRVLQDVLQFPEDRLMDRDTKRFIRAVNIPRWFVPPPDH